MHYGLIFDSLLSHRDIEVLLAERGMRVNYEAIGLWCNRFDPKFSTSLQDS